MAAVLAVGFVLPRVLGDVRFSISSENGYVQNFTKD
jgi:hypothetical protein